MATRIPRVLATSTVGLVLITAAACGNDDASSAASSGRVETTSTSTTAPAFPSSTTSTRQPVQAQSILGQVVFSSDRPVYGTSGGDMEIWAMNPNGSNKRPLTDHLGSDVQADLSPDGRQIVFIRAEDYMGGTQIMVMDSDGSNVTELTGHGGDFSHPRWSPDGTRIAYSDEGRIFTIKRDGTDVRTVWDDPENPVWTASWSPDGTRLVVDSYSDKTSARGLWVITLADSSTTHIFRDKASSPAWSPKGDRIAFTAAGSHIFTTRPDGSGVLEVIRGLGRGESLDPTWSPDGSRIAFSVGDSVPDEIYSIAADGTDKRNLSDNPAHDVQPTF